MLGSNRIRGLSIEMSSKATNEPVSWKDLIDKYRDKKEYRSRTCRIFGQASPGKPTPPEAACPCGRLVRCHSFDGQSLELQGLSKTPPAFEIPTEFTEGISKSAHSEQVKFNVYGTLESTNCKFLRIDNRCQPANLYQLLCDDCGGKPSVILSVYGGAKFFTITERLEKEFIRGIIDAATMAGKYSEVFHLPTADFLVQMPGFWLRGSTMVFPSWWEKVFRTIVNCERIPIDWNASEWLCGVP